MKQNNNQNNKQQTILRIVGAVCFVVIFLLVYSKIYGVLKYKDTHGNYLVMTDILKELPKDSLDIAFVGSSHVYCGIFPATIWEESGIATMDVGISGMDKDTCVATVKELFKYQNPKIVCVDLMGLTFDEHVFEGNVIRSLMAYGPMEPGKLTVDKDRIELIDKELSIHGERDDMNLAKASDYYIQWPVIHSRYQELKADDFRENPRYKYWLGEGGVMSTSYIPGPEVYNVAPEEFVLTEANKEYIDAVIDVVEEHGAELVFTIVPYPDYNKNDYIQYTAADMYIRERGYAMINGLNLKDEMGYSYETDYFNGDHLNYWGAEKVSVYLANYFMTFYDLEDHRDDPKYERWEKNWEYKHQQDQKWALTGEDMERVQLVVNASKGSNLCTIIYMEGELQEDYYDAVVAAGSYGISQEELLEGGAWIIDDGKLVARYLPEQGMEVDWEINSNMSVKICDSDKYKKQMDKDIDDEKRTTLKTSVYFNLDVLNMIHDEKVSGLEVFIYDKVLDEMIYNGVLR